MNDQNLQNLQSPFFNYIEINEFMIGMTLKNDSRVHVQSKLLELIIKLQVESNKRTSNTSFIINGFILLLMNIVHYEQILSAQIFLYKFV